MFDLVRNPVCWFSHAKTQFCLLVMWGKSKFLHVLLGELQLSEIAVK